MVVNWVAAFEKAENDLRGLIVLLDNLIEEEPTRLLRIAPFVKVMVAACEFLIANLIVIRKSMQEL